MVLGMSKLLLAGSRERVVVREQSLREQEDRRRCFRQGRKYWEMRTSRHMGLECPDYLAQIGREGER